MGHESSYILTIAIKIGVGYVKKLTIVKKKGTLKFKVTGFTGFSTKSVPDLHDFLNNTILWAPEFVLIEDPL